MNTTEYNALFLSKHEKLQEASSAEKKNNEVQEKKTSKELERQKKIVALYKNAGKGTLSAEGIKKLASQIENNDIKYCEFPEWVLETWLKADQHSAVPLRDNTYLDVDSIVAGEGEFDVEHITFGGVVVNHNRKNVGGVQAINLVRSELLDDQAVSKIQKLLLFQRAAIEATTMIERKQKREGGAGMGLTNPMDSGASSNTTGSGAGATGGMGGGGSMGGSMGGAGDLGGTAPTGDTGSVPMDSEGSPDLSGGAPASTPETPSGEGTDQTATGGTGADGKPAAPANPTPEPVGKSNKKTSKFKIHLK